MVRFVALAAVALSSLASAADSAGDAPTARAAIDAAARSYRGLKLEQASQELDRAQALPCTEDDAVLIDLYRGLIQFDLGRPEAATAAFRSALLRRPDATLPEASVSPKVVEQFERVRAQVRLERPVRPPEAPSKVPQPIDRAAPRPPALADPGFQGRASLRRFAWAPFTAGAVFLGLGIVGLAEAKAQHDSLVDPIGPPLRAQGPSIAQTGLTFQVIGWASLAACAVSVAVGLVFALLDPEPRAGPGLAPSSGGSRVLW